MKRDPKRLRDEFEMKSKTMRNEFEMELEAMRKDIEWLVQMIDSERESLRKRIESGKGTDNETTFNEGMGWALSKVLKMIYQLDKPEALSQDWIDEHSVAVAYDGIPDQTEIVYVDELENLIVPKQEIKFGQAHDKLREESILSEKSFDYYWNCINDNVEIDEPGNLIVPKKELPVIPKWVADGIESKKRAGKRLNLAMSEFPESKLRKELGIDEHECNELYARAWLDGYTVEEEQKYYVLVRDEEYGGFWFLTKNNNGNISIGVGRDCSEVDWDRLKLTEQEIKDYDERYWAFAKPVEELEE